MDVAALTAFVAPFLPYLYRAGQSLAEDAGKKLGAEAWEHVKRLWDRLHPGIEDEPAASKAARVLADHPEDEQARAAFGAELEKLLRADAGFAEEISRLWEQARAAKVVVAGQRGVAFDGSVTNSVIITGDHNKVGD